MYQPPTSMLYSLTIFCRFTLLLLSTTTCVHIGQAAKILIPGSLMRGHGHTAPLAALSAELTSRGHNVTILVPTDDTLKVRQKFAHAQATDIVEYSTVPFEESNFVRDFRAGKNPYPNFADSGKILVEVSREQVHFCHQLLNNKSIMQRLNECNFDLIIADMANGCEVLLPEVLQIPFIALTASPELLYMNSYIFGFPLEFSYDIKFFDVGTDTSSFMVRARNMFIGFIFYKVADFSSWFVPLQHEFNISPEMSIHDLARKAQFWLSQDSVVFEGVHPTMPNYSPVGGLAAARPGELPSEFQEFADASIDTCFIVFSCGSIVSSWFDSDLLESIALVLKRLPQRVVWKHGGPTPKNVGSNTMISTWIPQTALLAHPNACLFIGHGGLNGIYEALYHGVPMLLIPQMMADQHFNAAKVERNGYGVHLDKADFSAEAFENKIHQVLDDSRYADRVLRCSQILRDDDPMDRAVYWVEHILKFGGKHLRPGVFDLNFVQYYLIDVFAVLFLVVVLFILIVYICVKSCCYYKCRLQTKVVKTEKTE